jgi:hypothetical protein
MVTTPSAPAQHFLMFSGGQLYEFGQTEFPSLLPQLRGLRRPGCPSPALSKGTHDEVMKENHDIQIRIIPMLHWHSILNTESYFYQHMFTSVFQVYWSREDNGNSLSCREWKTSSASQWPLGNTPEPQIKEHLLLQEVWTTERCEKQTWVELSGFFQKVNQIWSWFAVDNYPYSF